MWDYKFIDKQLKYRLKTVNIKIVITERNFTGGLFTHIYWYKDEQIFAFNRYPDGSIRKNNFNIHPNVHFDPKKVAELDGRPKSWGKRIIIDKCGDNDLEKFNYISELLYQVIQKIDSTK